MARLSTHVLDTSIGLPAAGMRVDLHRIDEAARMPITSATTNSDGRTAEPLLSGDAIDPGIYELTFHAADYFRRRGFTLSPTPFLDLIVVRVGLDDPSGHYHVPLLLSPYGYTTYRGT